MRPELDKSFKAVETEEHDKENIIPRTPSNNVKRRLRRRSVQKRHDQMVRMKRDGNRLPNSGLSATVSQEIDLVHLMHKIPVISYCSNLDLNSQLDGRLRKRNRSQRAKLPVRCITETICAKKTECCTSEKKKWEKSSGFVTSDDEEETDHLKRGEKDANGNFQVEAILAVKEKPSASRHKPQRFFYVKWAGWSHAFDSWVRESDFGRLTWLKDQFYQRENALDCVKVNSDIPCESGRLRQLRNLFRWESEMNRILKVAHMKKIFVYNDLNDTLRPKGFKYITQNLLPKELQDLAAQNNSPSCDCYGDNCGENENCCSVMHPCYTFHRTLRQRFDMGNDTVIECNEFCKCSARCHTRIVQHGRRVAVAIVQTSKCGWGVFALEDIPANKFVVEYVGEVLPAEEARKRNNPTYQFDILENGKATYVVDARLYRNESAFVNHSCSPNLIAFPVYVERIPNYHRIGFFSVRKICKGEQLTLNYFVDFLDTVTALDEQDGIKCECGASDCIGYFPQVMYDEGSPRKGENAEDSSENENVKID